MQALNQSQTGLVSRLRYLLVACCVVFLPALGWAAPFAYITNQLDDTVSVMDTATNTVTATVAVGDFPDGVSVNAAGTRVYVTNAGNDSVSVINTATNAVVATVPVGGFPRGIVVNPAGTRVYVANNNDGTVTVIDTGTNMVVGAPVVVGSQPWGIAINTAGTRVYVANYADDTVSVIDTATNMVVGAPVAVGDGPLGIAINPAGTRLYVANSLEDVNPAHEGTVSVIDTGTNTVVATVIVGEDPYGIVVSPNGSRIYVANCCAQTVSVINATNNTVVATVAVGNNPQGISINAAGTRVYVANNGDGTVSTIDTATNTVLGAPVVVGGQPQGFGNFVGPGAAPTPDPIPDPIPEDPIPDLPPLPPVIGIGAQPTVLDLGAGQGPRMMNCLLATARTLFGADAKYLGQNANGIAKISVTGSRVLAFYPMQASTNAALGESIHLTGTNRLNVGTLCGSFNVAPASVNLVELGAVLHGLGLTASINSQGVLTMPVGDTVYVARPDFVSHLGASGSTKTPSLAMGFDGVYRFTDSAGTVQLFLPAFLDTDALAAEATVRQAGWIRIQTDGTAVYNLFSGPRFLLTADLTLSPTPPQNVGMLSWQDADNHFQFRGSTLAMPQGVHVHAY